MRMTGTIGIIRDGLHEEEEDQEDDGHLMCCEGRVGKGGRESCEGIVVEE